MTTLLQWLAPVALLGLFTAFMWGPLVRGCRCRLVFSGRLRAVPSRFAPARKPATLWSVVLVILTPFATAVALALRFAPVPASATPCAAAQASAMPFAGGPVPVLLVV